jgi:hypothetical protein
MILLHLEKREPSGKMFVKGWEFITKEIAQIITQIVGVRVKVEEQHLPMGFYKNHDHYFYEDEKIRYSSSTS